MITRRKCNTNRMEDIKIMITLEEMINLFTETKLFTYSPEGGEPSVESSDRYENRIGWDNIDKRIQITCNQGVATIYQGVNSVTFTETGDMINLEIDVSTYDRYEGTRQYMQIPKDTNQVLLQVYIQNQLLASNFKPEGSDEIMAEQWKNKQDPKITINADCSFSKAELEKMIIDSATISFTKEQMKEIIEASIQSDIETSRELIEEAVHEISGCEIEFNETPQYKPHEFKRSGFYKNDEE